MWNELSVETFYPQLYGTFKQHKVSENIHFLIRLSEQKTFIFDHIIDISDKLTPRDPNRTKPVRIGPAMTIFDGLFLS